MIPQRPRLPGPRPSSVAWRGVARRRRLRRIYVWRRLDPQYVVVPANADCSAWGFNLGGVDDLEDD